MCRSLSTKSFGVLNELVGITGKETQFLVKFIYFIYLDVIGSLKKFTKLIDALERIAPFHQHSRCRLQLHIL